MRQNRTALIVLLAILFLFFLQALSDFIQSIYAFGLLVTAFTLQLAAVLLLFSPLALILLRRETSRRWLIGLGAVAVLGRLVEPLLGLGGRLVACGISVGAFLLLFPLMLAFGTRRRQPSHSGTALGWTAAWGLILAVLLSIFFRTAGSSLDVSEVGLNQAIAWALAAVAGWVAWKYRLGKEESEPPRASSASGEEQEETKDAESHEARRLASLRSLSATPDVIPDTSRLAPATSRPAPIGRVIGLCIGLASVMAMLYFAFVSPSMIARSTGIAYVYVVCTLLLGVLAFSVLVGWTRFPFALSAPVVAAWNVLFALMLVLSILSRQVAFPATSNGYPLQAPPVASLANIPVYLMLVLSPVLFVDMMYFLRQLSADGPSQQQLGVGFSVASLFFLVMVFLQVFTTIYDYARPIGPVFRDRLWLVYLIAELGLILPLFLVPAKTPGQAPDSQPARFSLIAIASLAVLSVAASFLTAPKLPATPSAGGSLRVMTYNIQQGFDKVGNAALPQQLDAIRHVQPDVLGLEESDTARIANGNVDAVRYFANHLGMYSYYGPPTTVGTFGIALLSKYPIQRAQTFYMYSVAEQTACIQAQISANGKTYNVFVTHLGNGGPMVQLQNVLSRVDSLPNVILMGDFNFDPATPQYAVATATLADAWLLRWPGGRQLTGPGAEGRIDQLFVSPETQVTEAEYVPNPSSDHPYLYAVLR